MGRLFTRASGGHDTDGNAVGAEEVRQLKDILAPPIEPGLSKIAHLRSLRPRTNRGTILGRLSLFFSGVETPRQKC